MAMGGGEQHGASASPEDSAPPPSTAAPPLRALGERQTERERQKMREGNKQEKKRDQNHRKKNEKTTEQGKKNAAIEGKIKTGRQKVVEENAGRCKKCRLS